MCDCVNRLHSDWAALQTQFEKRRDCWQRQLLLLHNQQPVPVKKIRWATEQYQDAVQALKNIKQWRKTNTNRQFE